MRIVTIDFKGRSLVGGMVLAVLFGLSVAYLPLRFAAAEATGKGASSESEPQAEAKPPAEGGEKASSPAGAGSGWTVFRGNPALQGVASEVLKPPLKLAWSAKMTGPVVATAAIAGGGVFVGSQDGDFRAFDLADGTERWKREFADTIESSATVLGDRVFFGVGDGCLYAVNAADGKEVWKFQTDGEILGGVNVLEIEGNPHVLVGSYDNFLYCVDAQTGQKVWSVETGNYVNGTAAVANGLVMFGGCDAILYKTDAVTGKKLGEFEIGSYIANSIAVKDGVAYVCHYGNQAEAYSVADGKRLWVHKDGDFPYFASPAVVGDVVLVASRGKRLYCLNRSDGTVKWSFKARRSIDSSPVVSGDTVYFGSDDGYLYGVDLEKGKERWSYEIGDAITAAPAIAGGKLVIGGQDGKIYAFGPSS